MAESKLITCMQNMITKWEDDSDQRLIFLKCYQMMTENMLLAIDRNEFEDPIWVDQLLHNFTEYYFTALQAYEGNPISALKVCQIAHNYGRNSTTWAPQKLLLGVNAHINYDLIMTLADLLSPEWQAIPENQRGVRHLDYLYVNEIIGDTIDAVQDEIIEPDMPLMKLVDRLFLRGDEILISHLLVGWRDNVWHHTMLLLKANSILEQNRLVNEAERNALKHASAILMTDIQLF